MLYTLGVDLGGTNTAAGIISSDLKVVYKTSVPTKRDFAGICRDIASICSDCCAAVGVSLSDVKGIGVGAPGIVDPVRGVMVRWTNLGINDAPLGEKLSQTVGLPVFVENDANAAALGEYAAGAGRGVSNFVAVTVGTGIGGGAIIGGKLCRGGNFAAMELGHTVIAKDGPLCTCGRRGCFETLASASALGRRARTAAEAHPESLLATLDAPDAKAVFAAADRGDAAAKELLSAYIKDLACGLTNIINLLQPEVLCIGGGISGAGSKLLLPLRAEIDREDYAKYLDKRVKIKLAELGNDAGLIGAALLVQGI